MFSIEETLEEIINFIKKFFGTIFYTFFRSRSLLSDDAPNELIRPSLYMLICMFIYFGLDSLNGDSLYSVKLNKQIKEFAAFYEKSAIEGNILYVLPIGLCVWSFVYLISKVLQVEESILQKFRSFIFYWIGNSLLLSLAYMAMFMVLYNNQFEAFDQVRLSKAISMIVQGFYYASLYSPVLLIVIILAMLFQSTPRRTWLKFLTLPFLIWAGTAFCLKTSYILGRFMDISEQPLEILSDAGDKRITFKAECLDSACARYELSTLLFIHNSSKADLLLKKTDALYLDAKESESDPSKPWTISLDIKKMDGDSTKSLKIVKPAETLPIEVSGSVSATDWKIWQRASVQAAQRGSSYGYLELFTTNTEIGAYVYSERFTIWHYVDSTRFYPR